MSCLIFNKTVMSLDHLTPELIQARLQNQKSKRFWFCWKKPRKAVVALCLQRREDILSILMIRRAQREGDPWSGHMAFPGGHQDEIDHSELDTAHRETEEEVGLQLNQAHYLGALTPVRAVAKGISIRLVIHPHVFFIPSELRELQPNEEVAEIVWVPLETLLSGNCDGQYTFTRGKIKVNLPCWNYQQYTIWGLSYRMLSTFLKSCVEDFSEFPKKN